MRIISKLFFIPMTMLLFIGCSDKYRAFVSHYNFEQELPVPGYHLPDYWAAHPWKKDPSDSVPFPLKTEPRDTIADVFFIHPTTYTEARLGWNASINDSYTNAKTDYSSILYQSTVFNQHCRVFAPRYRQAHLSAFFTKEENVQGAFDTAYADIRNAFQYYLTHFNQSRPLIIAGHSQGGLMALKLLSDFFDNTPELQKKLVAAYIIGWPVPQNLLASIPPCSDPLQTGCVISWRTYKTNYIPSYIKLEPPVIVTNPLSWSTSQDQLGRSENAGSLLRDFNTIITNSAGAKVNGNILWTDKPKFPGSFFFRTKNYHIGDINLYYMNIRKNIEQRIHAHLSQ